MPLSSTERGLGYAHRQARLALLRLHVEGTPCAWCGQPMYRRQKLHADHTTPRSRGGMGTLPDRLLHAVCNIRRGNGVTAPTRPQRQSRQWL